MGIYQKYPKGRGIIGSRGLNRVFMVLIIHFQFPIVHPCDKADKGGCNQVCIKRKAWHVCSCKSGFMLGNDKRICNKGL